MGPERLPGRPGNPGLPKKEAPHDPKRRLGAERPGHPCQQLGFDDHHGDSLLREGNLAWEVSKLQEENPPVRRPCDSVCTGHLGTCPLPTLWAPSEPHRMLRAANLTLNATGSLLANPCPHLVRAACSPRPQQLLHTRESPTSPPRPHWAQTSQSTTQTLSPLLPRTGDTYGENGSSEAQVISPGAATPPELCRVQIC